MKAFRHVYLERDRAALDSAQIPQILRDAVRAHWDGQLGRAEELHAAGVAELADVEDLETREILQGDRIFLSVKMSLKVDVEAAAAAQRTSIGRLVAQYALAHKYFFIDQTRSQRELLRCLLPAVGAGYLQFWTTVCFLVGHLRASAGKRHTGYFLSTAAFRFARFCGRKGRPLAAFTLDSIYACYPYTLLTCRKLQGIRRVVTFLEKALQRDPYFGSIFHVSALYAFAYSGDVARTELAANRLAAVSRGSVPTRYVSIARVMQILPVAMRGYGYSVAEKIDVIVQAHDASLHDPLINSQFYRAAAVVYLYLGNQVRALELIDQAAAFRKRQSSFQAWAAFDSAVSRLAKDHSGGVSSLDELLGWNVVQPARYQIGAVLMRLTAVVSECVDGESKDFHRCAAEVIRDHLGSERCEVADAEDPTHEKSTLLKVGPYFLLSSAMDAASPFGDIISEISVLLQVFERLIGQLRAAGRDVRRAASSIAIAKTTRMLAHDVRRPFSTLQIVLNMIERSDNLEDLKSIAARAVPEIRSAMTSVSGMLDDVMQIGSEGRAQTAEVQLAEQLEQDLEECFRIHRRAAVSIAYDLAHTTSVKIDRLKISRVVSNIVSNAIQAMRGRGKLWIHSRDVEGEGGRRFVEVCIGNDQSFIEPEDLPHLFDVFFTKGKANGTGLGLAIAHQFVAAHGGHIWCQSSRVEGEVGHVEFFFTLPSGELAAFDAGTLPRDSAAAQQLSTLRGGALRSEDDIGRTAQLEAAICVAVEKSGAPIKVVIVDDEAVYSSDLVALLRAGARTRDAVVPFVAGSDAELWAIMAGESPAVVVLDVDLGAESEGGFSLARELRRRGFQGTICLHSNRATAETYRAAIDAGADAFLPKPMTRSHLLGLIALQPS